MTPRLRLLVPCVVVLAAAGVSFPAMAHHPTGGMMPTTFMHGILSGIGHPVIGLDHLSFIVGIGLLARIAGFGLALPGLFIGAMVGGLGLHLAGASIPYAELLLAVSVALIGVAVWMKRPGGGSWPEAGAFALAGLLHGYAFAEAVVGAETTPILAYIIGLAATQMTIATAVYYLAGAGAGRPVLTPVAIRAAGAVIAVVGVALALMHGFTA